MTTETGDSAMLSVRLCPQCSDVCSTSSAQCATCGHEESHASQTVQVPVAGHHREAATELRSGPVSRGVWRMIVDALMHGRRPSFPDRHSEHNAQQVMREHVAHPAVVATEPVLERIDNIA